MNSNALQNRLNLQRMRLLVQLNQQPLGIRTRENVPLQERCERTSGR